MKDRVFQALIEAARKAEPVALGVISAAKGSSPQKIGAKALFYGDGRIEGTLGGGCLEAEVQQRAIESLRTGRPSCFDLLLDHDFGWDDGLICGGKVEGLILPNAQDAGEQFWAQIAERATAVTWGVGKDFSIRRLPRQEPKIAVPDKKAGHDAGTCDPSGAAESAKDGGESRGIEAHANAGRVENYLDPTTEMLYSETVSPPCTLWIAGAGHIAQAVAPLALQLDFEVTVFDDRPALASRQFFPEGVALTTEIWEKLLVLPLPKTPCFGLIVTRGHRHDALVLQEWIHQPFVFLGMIGSARKARIIFEQFAQEKLATAEELSRVACPVGIKIRSKTVPEIAVSIMAQFIQKRAELVPAEERQERKPRTE
jgi:xanthine dehydrogenase accessory factor